mmetsp:Transcript_62670/g.185211  ORF Transcript_62670/g.185211 Transcript_62670/m.185211 type:complete len:129 (-) Transcript_62670:52-438(-)|eukprot:CAMPEP_0113532096 /NCGR_PEP_ID=MMETSP0015_2-20120614/3859_1 /TAXON_ID=2838 /ORGANISM="Odontella" /LENGTH=128 /DNA_ID=CAMNT_0000430999 /DNA_START=353 /DNA_END=739 /DNA_ORIENTATION=- /assembly_acc=CAM_ASM_000160
MGKGISRTIKEQFPEEFSADCKTEKWDRNKLGTVTHATLSPCGRDFIIVNGYTQYRWHGAGVLADYEAIRSVMRHVKKEFGGKKIGYPLIVAGLAKGDWNIIEGIIRDELQGEDHTLVLYSSPSPSPR